MWNKILLSSEHTQKEKLRPSEDNYRDVHHQRWKDKSFRMGHICLQISFQVPTKPNALKVKFLWPLFPYLDKGGNYAELSKMLEGERL